MPKKQKVKLYNNYLIKFKQLLKGNFYKLGRDDFEEHLS